MTEGKLGKRPSPALLAALISAAVGAACLHFYLRRYEDEVRGGELVPVLSLTQDVAAGTLLQEALLDVRYIPERYLDERHVPANDFERVQGNRTQVALAAGDGLRWTDLGVAEGPTQLSSLVPVGRRAVRVSETEASFGGLLRAGDRVDVLITEAGQLGDSRPPRTWTLLENVMVLAVGDVVSVDGESASGAGGRGGVTLSVRPQEAAHFESQRRRGTLSLALRNPHDLALTRIEEAGHGQ